MELQYAIPCSWVHRPTNFPSFRYTQSAKMVPSLRGEPKTVMNPIQTKILILPPPLPKPISTTESPIRDGVSTNDITLTKTTQKSSARPSMRCQISSLLASPPASSASGRCPPSPISTPSVYPKKRYPPSLSIRQANGSPLVHANSGSSSYGNGSPSPTSSNNKGTTLT